VDDAVDDSGAPVELELVRLTVRRALAV